MIISYLMLKALITSGCLKLMDVSEETLVNFLVQCAFCFLVLFTLVREATAYIRDDSLMTGNHK